VLDSRRRTFVEVVRTNPRARAVVAFRTLNVSIPGHSHHDSHATITGLPNLQGHLSLASNRPQGRDISTLSKALRAQVTNCIRFSAGNNDLLEFLGDRLVKLITALIVEGVKIDECNHTVRLLEYIEYLSGMCAHWM